MTQFELCRVALVANGAPPSTAWLRDQLQRAEHVIAVDGGLNILHQAGLKPHFLIGDFDSVDPQIFPLYDSVPRTVLQLDKDETDLEVAISFSLQQHPLVKV